MHFINRSIFLIITDLEEQHFESFNILSNPLNKERFKMLQYLYQTLIFFRKDFSRSFTWLMFCMVILEFIGTHEMKGVTSFCQFWSLDTAGYHAFLNFFKRSAWSLDKIIASWGILQMALDFTMKHDLPSILFLDAFFLGQQY